MGQFVLDLQRFAKKVEARADLAVTKIVYDVGSSVVLKSPVGDANYWKSKPPKGYVGGHFRGNWKYGEDNINYETTPAIDATGQISIAAIQTGVKPGEAARHNHYISNSLPYAERLENGWSRQAPQGMVKLTVLEFQRIVAEAADAVK